MKIEDTEKNVFVLGLMVLFGWMFIVVLCSAPELFRDMLRRYLCCCWYSAEQKERRREKIKKARERVRSASKTFITTSMAATPSSILLQQVMGSTPSDDLNAGRVFVLDIPEPIAEVELNFSKTVNHMACPEETK